MFSALGDEEALERWLLHPDNKTGGWIHSKHSLQATHPFRERKRHTFLKHALGSPCTVLSPTTVKCVGHHCDPPTHVEGMKRASLEIVLSLTFWMEAVHSSEMLEQRKVTIHVPSERLPNGRCVGFNGGCHKVVFV